MQMNFASEYTVAHFLFVKNYIYFCSTLLQPTKIYFTSIFYIISTWYRFCLLLQMVLSSTLHLGTVSAISVTPAGTVLVADQTALKVYSLSHHLPETDHNGDYMVCHLWLFILIITGIPS